MNSYKVIIIDQKNTMQKLRGVLEHEGLTISSSYPCDGIPAVQTTKEMLRFDILIPEECMTPLFQKIQAVFCPPYFIMTARIHNSDQLAQMEKGVRDTINRLIGPVENGDRLKTDLEPDNHFSEDGKLVVGPVCLDSRALRVLVYDAELTLTPIEFNLLKSLISSPEKVFSRKKLTTTLYGADIENRHRTIDCHIANLRKKISRHLPGKKLIRTVYGTGYAFRNANDYPQR